MHCALLKYFQEQHNQHPYQTFVSVTFQLIKLPHQRVYIFENQTARPASRDDHDPYQPSLQFEIILSVTTAAYVTARN